MWSFQSKIYWLRNTGNLTESEREILNEPSDMAKLFSQCVGKTNALVFLSIIQTLDKFTAAYCVCGQAWTDGTVLCLWQAAWRPHCSCELSIQTWTDNMKFHLTFTEKMYNLFLVTISIIYYSFFKKTYLCTKQHANILIGGNIFSIYIIWKNNI